jgi:hypothetical protein
MMGFEWFDPEIGMPMVSIADYGITFSKSAVKILDRPEYVALGFDKENKRVVVKEVGEDFKNKIPFIDKERNGYVRINNRDFVRFVMKYLPEVNFTSKATRFLTYYDDEEDILVIEMTRPLDVEEQNDNKEDNEE